MRTHVRAAALALIASSTAVFALAQAPAHTSRKPAAKRVASLPRCPVMNEPVDFSLKTDTPDGPVYFCCKSCIKQYESNPNKYASKVAAQRKALRALPRVQVACPLTGKPINREVFVESGGKKVYFCCADCKSKYEAAPQKYAKRLEAAYTYQTRCPVMGGEIDPEVYTDLPGGKRVYFCCKGCEDKLLSNPQKYARKLAEQGTIIDVDKIRTMRKGGSQKRHHGGHKHP